MTTHEFIKETDLENLHLNRTFIDKSSPSFIELITRVNEKMAKLCLNSKDVVIYYERNINENSFLYIMFRGTEERAIFSLKERHKDIKCRRVDGYDMGNLVRKIIPHIYHVLTEHEDDPQAYDGTSAIYIYDGLSKKIRITNEPIDYSESDLNKGIIGHNVF